MKKTISTAILFWVSALSIYGLPKVAVLDIIPQAKIDTSVIVPITESLMEEVVSARAYIVLDRAYIEKVLTEQAFQLSSMVSDTDAAQAGQYLGADYVITGKVQVLGDSYFLVAKMIEVRTGIIVSQSTEQGEGKINVLLGMAHSLGKKLVGGSPISPLTPAAVPKTGSSTGTTEARKVTAGFLIPTGMDDIYSGMIPALLTIKERYVKNEGWLDMQVAERVNAETFKSTVKRLIEISGCRIIISADWGFSQLMAETARLYPSVNFWSVGGELVDGQDPNLGIYDINEFFHFYLMGIVAGSMSRSGKIGLLSESSNESWVVRSANIFALGVKAATPRGTVYLRFLPEGHWDKQGPEREATEALIRERCDFICGSIGSEVLEVCHASCQEGKPVRALHPDRSYKWFPEVIVSGPMRDFSVLWERPLLGLRDGTWKKEWYIPTSAVRFGGPGIPFNPAFESEIGKKRIKTPDLGEVPLLDLLERRSTQYAAGEFNPFTGPIRDQRGTIRIPSGVKPDWETIDSMDYLIDNIKGTVPGR